MKESSKEYDIVLQDCLTQIESGRETLASVLEQHAEIATELRPSLEAALWLRNHRQGLAPRPGFLAGLQSHLLSQIRTPNLAAAPHSSFQDFIQQLQHRNYILETITLSLLVFCLVILGQNIILAARLSLPGEPLYAVKLGIEQAQLLLTPSKTGDTHLHMQFAQRRTGEIIELILEEEYDHIPGTVEALNRQVNQSLALLDDLAVHNADEAEVLGGEFENTLSSEYLILEILANTYPPDAHPVIVLALQATQAGLTALQE